MHVYEAVWLCSNIKYACVATCIKINLVIRVVVNW